MTSNNNTKQTFWVSLGSLFAFCFSIISTMILSRYLEKDDYGTYRQVLFIYQTFLTIFTLGLPRSFSYFLPRIRIDQAENLVNRISYLLISLGALISFIIYFFSDKIALVLNNPDLSIALKYFAPTPLLLLPTMGLEGILATYKKTYLLALYTILTRLLMLVCVAIPVALYKNNYTSAIIGLNIASLATFLIAVYLKKIPFFNVRSLKCDITSKEILSFSLPLLYASIWGIIITSADQFFLSRYFGNETFAEFANGYIELPFVSMVVGSAATVLSPIISKLSFNNIDATTELLSLWKRVFEKSAMIIYPIITYCWFFSDTIMIFLYGDLYQNSGLYFKIKLVSYFYAIIIYAPLLINIGKVKEYSKIHMYNAIILVILCYISIHLFKSPYVISLISLFTSILKSYFLIRIVAKYFNVKLFELFPIKLIIKVLIPSIVILSLIRIVVINFCDCQSIVILLVSFIVYLTLFSLWSVMIKMNYLSIIKPLLIRTKK